MNKLEKLKAVLLDMGKITVAVSGGVDSMSLAFVASKVLPGDVKIVHAKSHAVPKEATERVIEYAKKYSWDLAIVDADEMANVDYVNNPVDRCYYCKTSLYSSLKRFDFGQVVSGTNLDDLSDFRPGLKAATELQIRHPFVEASLTKNNIRDIARLYNLSDISDLPASPCLASRVETGIKINPDQLDLIYRIEKFITGHIKAENIRCRILAQSLVIQIDQGVLDNMPVSLNDFFLKEAAHMATSVGINLPVLLLPYVRGSAFKRVA